MKILESMLKKWVNVPSNILELTNQKIIEVESFQQVNTSTNLVIGHVLTCEDHPNSDHLHVTTVNLGDRIEQIVCGASNVAQGQYVIVAQVGAVLPGNFQIKASKIRGVESNGMICSLRELGFEDSVIPEAFKDGIYYFDQPQEIGKPALEVIHQEGWVMELKLTPNRGDLLSHLGFAYDLASVTNQEVHIPSFKIKETSTKNPLSVKIETKGCGRYYARYVEEVVIKESPWWLKSALIASDIHPINNVVDISNYVLIEYGTPLHMFDAKKFGSDHILVRDAKKGEEVISLDDEKRILEHDDVVITNGKDVVAIGGVMGLQNTMIDEHTTSVIIEAAYFEPKRIQKTSKRLNLRSDSSLRFERGIDENRVRLGLERATELLIELADAKVYQGVSECIHTTHDNPIVEVEHGYFQEALGTVISEKELMSYFKAYHYMVNKTEKTYRLQAPSWRQDLQISADFLEEIARIHGLDKIPMTAIDKPTPGKLTFKQKRLRQLRHHLSNLGLYEVITYSLLEPSEVHRYHVMGDPVSVLLPLSEDKKTLRQSLIHGLLETIRFNQSRQSNNVSIFEMGNCFAEGEERFHLGIAMSGAWHTNPWKKEQIKPDFYVLKGLLSSIFEPLDITLDYQATDRTASYHPYKQADILYNNHVIGQLAELHPNEEKRLGIDHTTILEIDLTELLQEGSPLKYQAISKFPNVTRDLAIVVDEKVTAGELLKMIEQTAKKILVSVDVFDVFQGSSIEKGKKSIAFSLVFNDKDKTLSADDVDQVMKKITNRLAFSYQATIRS